MRRTSRVGRPVAPESVATRARPLSITAVTPSTVTELGYTSEQVNKFAFTALTRRLKVIGVPLVAAEPAAA